MLEAENIANTNLFSRSMTSMFNPFHRWFKSVIRSCTSLACSFSSKPLSMALLPKVKTSSASFCLVDASVIMSWKQNREVSLWRTPVTLWNQSTGINYRRLSDFAAQRGILMTRAFLWQTDNEKVRVIRLWLIAAYPENQPKIVCFYPEQNTRQLSKNLTTKGSH